MTLSYAPRPPRRRRWIFIAIAIGAAYALGAWVFRDWTAIHAYARLWVLEYRCGHYHVDPSQIGYDEQASDHPNSRPGEWGTDGHWSRLATSVPIPAVFDSLCDAATGSPSPVVGNIFAGSPPTDLLYLHTLQTRAGTKRIILIGVETPAGGIDLDIPADIEAELIDPDAAPGSQNVDPILLWQWSSARIHHEFKIHMGEQVSGDPASFELRYTLDGQNGTMRGTLSDDGKTISMTPDALFLVPP